jgi:hypothetical protein
MGEKWEPAEGVFPIAMVSVAGDPLNSRYAFAADQTVGYLFASTDGGEKWQSYDLSLALSRISSMSLTSTGKVLAGTVSEGVIVISPVEASESTQLSTSSE